MTATGYRCASGATESKHEGEGVVCSMLPRRRSTWTTRVAPAWGPSRTVDRMPDRTSQACSRQQQVGTSGSSVACHTDSNRNVVPGSTTGDSDEGQPPRDAGRRSGSRTTQLDPLPDGPAARRRSAATRRSSDRDERRRLIHNQSSHLVAAEAAGHE